MDEKTVILLVILGVMALPCFVISVLQFCQKGVPLNNMYLYASEVQRARMNKAPLFRQSGVAFAGVGCLFLLTAMMLYVDCGPWPVLAGALALVIYAIVSSVRIRKQSRDERE